MQGPEQQHGLKIQLRKLVQAEEHDAAGEKDHAEGFDSRHEIARCLLNTLDTPNGITKRGTWKGGKNSAMRVRGYEDNGAGVSGSVEINPALSVISLAKAWKSWRAS